MWSFRYQSFLFIVEYLTFRSLGDWGRERISRSQSSGDWPFTTQKGCCCPFELSIPYGWHVKSSNKHLQRRAIRSHSIQVIDSQVITEHRLVLWGMPPTNWDKYIADVFFLTQPAGWVQFIEFHWDINSVPSGTAAHKVLTSGTLLMRPSSWQSRNSHIHDEECYPAELIFLPDLRKLDSSISMSPKPPWNTVDGLLHQVLPWERNLTLETDEEKERRRVVNYAFWTLVCLVVETKEEFKREFPDDRERMEFGKAAQEELLSGRYPLENTMYHANVLFLIYQMVCCWTETCQYRIWKVSSIIHMQFRNESSLLMISQCPFPCIPAQRFSSWLRHTCPVLSRFPNHARK